MVGVVPGVLEEEGGGTEGYAEERSSRAGGGGRGVALHLVAALQDELKVVVEGEGGAQEGLVPAKRRSR